MHEVFTRRRWPARSRRSPSWPSPAATVAPAAGARRRHHGRRRSARSCSRYCVGCHNDRVKSGGFSWTELDLARPDHNAKRAEDVIRKVRAGLMPPAGARRPDAAALKEFSTRARHAARRDGRARIPTYKAPGTASPESPRIPQRGARSARHRRRRLGAAAARRAHRRLRQHVRRAHRQPGADAGVHPRRRQGGAPGARRSRRRRR